MKLLSKFLFIVLSGSLCNGIVYGQDATDALRYSFINPMGTARGLGIGNAMGSVGGDFSSLSINPAGIGVYRRSEVMITPSLKINNVNSTYLNETNSEPNGRVNFNNIGIVFTKTPKGKRYESSSWKAVSFGLGVNRLADFSRNYSYSGLNTESSFSEMMANDANNYPGNVNNDPSSLAYMGYTSYIVELDNQGYYSIPFYATDQLRQKRKVEERGGMNEIVLSLGGNYREKLLLGATLGFPTLNFRRESYFEEVDATNDPANFFKAFRYTENLQTTGIGFNAKFGVIYKPADNFRIGAAIHTPTWIALSDIYNQSITSNTEGYKASIGASDTDPITSYDAPENVFNYSVRTPWKGVLSMTGILGKYGFITADYEYVDYTSARLGFSSEYTQQESIRNAEIRKLTKAASNIRLGAEAKLENLFIRAGFGFYGSPYKNAESDMNRLNISAGLGYRTDNFFADLGFMHTRLNEYQTPYSLPDVVTPTATLSNRFNSLALTLGFKM
ncbi:MAG TPA: hypothetical protein VL098_13250 [Flavipsychrobacter sp.]|nr:hypothetical protein [Flavipsychrobacter sp.]